MNTTKLFDIKNKIIALELVMDSKIKRIETKMENNLGESDTHNLLVILEVVITHKHRIEMYLEVIEFLINDENTCEVDIEMCIEKWNAMLLDLTKDLMATIVE